MAPGTEASPPITMPTRNVMERNTLNESGATSPTPAISGRPGQITTSVTPRRTRIARAVSIGWLKKSKVS